MNDDSLDADTWINCDFGNEIKEYDRPSERKYAAPGLPSSPIKSLKDVNLRNQVNRIVIKRASATNLEIPIPENPFAALLREKNLRKKSGSKKSPAGSVIKNGGLSSRESKYNDKSASLGPNRRSVT
jgi:hypothetical protein